jgi:hypothetical protein
MSLISWTEHNMPARQSPGRSISCTFQTLHSFLFLLLQCHSVMWGILTTSCQGGVSPIPGLWILVVTKMRLWSWLSLLVVVGSGAGRPMVESNLLDIDHISPGFDDHKGVLRKRHLEKRGVQVRTSRAIPFAPRGSDKGIITRPQPELADTSSFSANIKHKSSSWQVVKPEIPRRFL